jgi:BMFP domain-containing protein YqiC
MSGQAGCLLSEIAAEGNSVMQSENRFFDDFAKMMNGLAGTMAGAGREAEAQLREKAKGLFGGIDFVSREEFDAVKAMAAAARDEADALKARLDAVEDKLFGSSGDIKP